MVYNGPSTGCLACRKRKVRCDKGRPKCNNCTKRKQDCPGYGDVFDSRHRDQTRSIIRRVDSKQSNSLSPVPLAADAATDHGSATSGRTSTPTPSHQIPDVPLPYDYSLSPDVESSALNFFFNSFGRALGDCRALHSFMTDLGPLFRNTRTHSPLHAATTSVALNMYMLFAKQGSDTKLARGFYLQAVSGLKKEIANAAPASFDELIMTVLALDSYDNLNCSFKSNVVRTDHHKKGALALLKHRGNGNFDSELSRAVVSHVRTNLCHWAIDTGAELSPEIVEILSHPSLPSRNQNMLDILSMRIGPLMARYRAMPTDARQQSGSIRNVELENLLQEALELDDDLNAWELNIPARWHPIILTGQDIEPSIQSAGVYNDRCPVYADLAICEVYNKYRYRRLVLLRLVQHLCLRSKTEVSADLFDAKGLVMQELVDGLCESVPFCIGDAISDEIPTSVSKVKYPSTWKNGSPVPHPSVDHPGSAMLTGGWIVYSSLLHITQLASPDYGITTLQLRKGQAEWIQQQLQRTARVYTFIIPEKKPSQPR